MDAAMDDDRDSRSPRSPPPPTAQRRRTGAEPPLGAGSINEGLLRHIRSDGVSGAGADAG